MRKIMKHKKLCDCLIYCRFDGAKLKKDCVGHYCPTFNCKWHYGVDDCFSEKTNLWNSVEKEK